MSWRPKYCGRNEEEQRKCDPLCYPREQRVSAGLAVGKPAPVASLPATRLLVKRVDRPAYCRELSPLAGVRG